MIGRTNTGGGGGLNFQVVGGTTAPSNAKENMIWVNTNKINNYYFSATEPGNVVDYDVWISTGTESSIAFNALKKNGIQVYPISAKQYVSGAWVDVTAKSCQGGVWVDWWIGQLYEPGNEYEHITGGWTGTGKKSASSSSMSAKAPIIERHTDGLYITSQSSGSGMVHAAQKINVGDFNTVTFTGEFYRGGTATNNLILGAWGDLGGTYYTSTCSARTDVPSQTGSVTLDISGLHGKFYIGLAMVSPSRVTLTDVILS
jgi:hypothetical protein